MVVAVDDFERSSIESFRQPIIDFTKFTDVKYQFFANPYDKDRASCQIAKLEKDGNRSGFLILVNNRNNGGKKCLANNLYSSMNIRHDGLFRLSLKDFERSEENLDRITDLHLIVLGVFYSEKFPVLVDHDSARTAFSKLYPELLRRYKELRQGGREL